MYPQLEGSYASPYGRCFLKFWAKVQQGNIGYALWIQINIMKNTSIQL